jgi:ubiquinone biosynthesis monooxygenase Coq7
MWDGEKKHIQTFDKLITQHRVRPTALYPLWRAAGWGLGAGTALLGREAGMACTEAVEVRAAPIHWRPLFTVAQTVIGEHYDEYVPASLTDTDLNCDHSQIKELEAIPNKHPSMVLLKEVLTEFRDDELEHLDTAVQNDAQKAPAHALLSAIIASGCRGAIAISKRI